MATENLQNDERKERNGYIIGGVLELILLITWMIFCFMYSIPKTGIFGYVAMIILGSFIGFLSIRMFEKAGLKIFKDW